MGSRRTQRWRWGSRTFAQSRRRGHPGRHASVAIGRSPGPGRAPRWGGAVRRPGSVPRRLRRHAPSRPRHDRAGTRRVRIRPREEALGHELPILGICRGAQALNVALGGTLHQHLPEVVGNAIVHRQSAGRTNAHARLSRSFPAACWPNSWEAAPVAVNSFHHQAVDRLGKRAAGQRPRHPTGRSRRSRIARTRSSSPSNGTPRRSTRPTAARAVRRAGRGRDGSPPARARRVGLG